MSAVKSESKLFKGDAVLWAVIFSLITFSILVVYSATGTLAFRTMGGDTEYYLLKHTFLVGLALAVLWVCHLIDYLF